MNNNSIPNHRRSFHETTPFQLSTSFFIFNYISLLYNIFFSYLTCFCPYIHTILWYQQLALVDPLSWIIRVYMDGIWKLLLQLAYMDIMDMNTIHKGN